jgi:hypothetical protein
MLLRFRTHIWTHTSCLHSTAVLYFLPYRDWNTVTCFAMYVSSRDCRTSSWTRTGTTPSQNFSSVVLRYVPWREESQTFQCTSMSKRKAENKPELTLNKSDMHTNLFLDYRLLYVSSSVCILPDTFWTKTDFVEIWYELCITGGYHISIFFLIRHN